jgi:hypothetical protein
MKERHRIALALFLSAIAYAISEAIPNVLIPWWACLLFGFALVYLGWFVITVVIGDD